MYPISDHCDGIRFFNPSNLEGNSLWDVIKMMLTTHFAPWPKVVKNDPALDLHRTLGQDEVAITFVNHATVLVQTEQFNFLTDPVWSDRVSPFRWLGPIRHRQPGIPFEQLPKIDFVLISHNHYDHMDISTLKRLNHTFHPRFFVPLGNKRFLMRCGIKQVTELDWWQNDEQTPHLKVSFAPAEHFSGRGVFDKNKTLWGSYMIVINNHSFYFGGDSAYSPHFKAIRKELGAPDIAFLPIGAYCPRWFMKKVHMNPDEAIQAHLDLGASQSIGIHFGTFRLTAEKIDQPIIDLEAAITNRTLLKNTFITLLEGRTEVFVL